MTTGILGYGAYLPRWRLKGQDIASVWSADWEKIFTSLNVNEKAVPAIDEDAATIAVAAAINALARADISAQTINTLFVGSESHPYAVKPTATMVAQALGINLFSHAADLEFACKAGTAAFITCCSLVSAGLAAKALAIGADVAQAAPGDMLEYTAAAGGAAFILGPDEGTLLAVVEQVCSMTTDTPDFWRRNLAMYPEHTGRFTAEPSYFYHVHTIAQKLLDECGLQPSAIDHVVFHQPNARFPVVVATELGFTQQQVALGLLASDIGNTYSAATLLGLTAVLDQAGPNQRILVVSYGSGSGADAILLRTTENLAAGRVGAPATAAYIARKQYVTYQHYRRIMGVVHGGDQ